MSWLLDGIDYISGVLKTVSHRPEEDPYPDHELRIRVQPGQVICRTQGYVVKYLRALPHGVIHLAMYDPTIKSWYNIKFSNGRNLEINKEHTVLLVLDADTNECLCYTPKAEVA